LPWCAVLARSLLGRSVIVPAAIAGLRKVDDAREAKKRKWLIPTYGVGPGLLDWVGAGCGGSIRGNT